MSLLGGTPSNVEGARSGGLVWWNTASAGLLLKTARAFVFSVLREKPPGNTSAEHTARVAGRACGSCLWVVLLLHLRRRAMLHLLACAIVPPQPPHRLRIFFLRSKSNPMGAHRVRL